MKPKKLVKKALKQPELYSPAELEYMRLWLAAHKAAKMNKQCPQKVNGS